jgi:hypothetical protein
LLRESAALASRLQDAPSRDHLHALMIMLSSRVVGKDELSQIWEDIQMMKLKIIAYAEEKGMEPDRAPHKYLHNAWQDKNKKNGGAQLWLLRATKS